MTDTDNVELKKRSRRRLVGAAALALLAAIILPMVMDQEPGPSGQDIQITIPDRGERTRPIDGPAPSDAEPEVAPPPQEQPLPVVPTLAPPAAQPERPVAPQPVPSVPPPASTPQAAPAPARPAAAQPTQPPVQAPQDEAARVRAILDGQTPPPAPAAANGFVVQIAAFGEPARAQALVAELKGKGFAAYTEQAGTVTRVRVGPFGNRAEADQAAGRLKALGQNPVVTAR